MAANLILDPDAELEFERAYDWYEARQTGLGDRFAVAVEAVFRRICASPRMHQMVYGTARRAVVPKWPFVVIYDEDGSDVYVYAVYHTSRDPSGWQSRIP
ncbi:MAG: type II toxin-antitoxin system RelE/ParE family toxin [Gemmataceae bacterium]